MREIVEQPTRSKLRWVIMLGGIVFSVLVVRHWLPDSSSVPNDVAGPTLEGGATSEVVAVPIDAVHPVEPTAGFLGGGRVVDVHTRQGISAARLEVQTVKRGVTKRRHVVLSDDQGRFDLGRWSATYRSATLVVTHPEYATRRYSTQLGWPREISLFPGARVSGTIETLEGIRVHAGGELAILEAAELEPGWVDPENVRPGETIRGADVRAIAIADDGSFSFAATTSTIALQARVAGYGPGATSVIDVDPRRATIVVVRVGSEHRLRGEVVDLEGAPVAGARVDVVAALADRDPDRFHVKVELPCVATTDADGRFEIDRLAESFVSLKVSHERFDPVPLDGASTDTQIRIELSGCGWLVGRLGGGAPTEGVLFLENGTEVPVDCRDGGFSTRAVPAPAQSGWLSFPGFAMVAIEWAHRVGPIDVGSIELSPLAEMTVRVEDEAGSSIARARVEVAQQRIAKRWKSVSDGFTNDEGLAVVRAPSTGAVYVRASGYGFVPSSVSFDGETVEQPIVLSLAPAGSVNGRVVRADGTAVFGAKVSGQYPSVRDGRTVQQFVECYTGARGHFALDGLEAPSAFRLKVVATGLPGASAPVELSSAGQLVDVGDIVLEGGRSVRGVVQDSSGAVVADVLAKMWGQSSGVSQWTRSDASGQFHFESVTEDTHWLTLSHRQYLDGVMQQVEVAGADVEGLVVVMQKGKAYDGVIVDAAGAPIEGARILVNAQGMIIDEVAARARTDVDGRFQLDRAPSGPIRFRVQHEHYKSVNLQYDSVESIEVPFVLPSGAKLHVEFVVRGGNAPPTTATIRLHGGSGGTFFTDSVEDGVLVRGGLSPGRFTLSIDPRGFVPTDPVEIDLIDNETTVERVVLEPQPDPYEIVVVDPSGQPVSQAQIAFFESHSRGIDSRGRGVTDGRGVFAATVPLGPETAVMASTQLHAPVVADPARDSLIDGRITLVLAEPSVLEVTVVAPDDLAGRGLSSHVTEVRSRFPNLWIKSVPVVEGFARHSNLADGRFRVTLRRGQDIVARREVELAAGERRELTIDLGGSTAIDGTVLLNGTPVSGGRLEIERPEFSTSVVVGGSGFFDATLPGRGRYRFSYRREGSGVSRSYNVSTGSVEIDFVTARLTGLVLDADGDPVPSIAGRLSGTSAQRFTTDAAGRFAIEGVPAGEYTFSFQRPPAGQHGSRMPFVVGETADVVYRFTRARSLEVVFETPSGAAPNRWNVYHLTEEGRALTQKVGDNLVEWPTDGAVALIHADRFAPVTIAIAPDDERVVVRLAPSGRVFVRIRDGSAVQLVDHEFRVEPIPPVELHPWLRRQDTSQYGQGALRLAPGRFRFTTTLPSGVEVEREVEVAEGVTTEIELQ